MMETSIWGVDRLSFTGRAVQFIVKPVQLARVALVASAFTNVRISVSPQAHEILTTAMSVTRELG